MSAQSVRKTILLVEDDDDDVWLVKKGLEPFFPSFDLQVVSDGAQAIEYLAGLGGFADRTVHPLPSVVLLDIQLPALSGLEVLRWIRRQPALSGMIVVMLTGSESPKEIQAAYDLHVNSFLKKSPLLAMPTVAGSVLGYWIRHNEDPSARGGLGEA